MKDFNPDETITILTRMMAELPKIRGSSLRKVNKEAGLDLIRNLKRNSSPLVLSMFIYCKWLGVDPCFFLTVIILVQKGEITEAQGLEILKEPAVIQQTVGDCQNLILMEINKIFQNLSETSNTLSL